MHYHWVISHPIINFLIIMSVIIITGVLVYHLIEKPSALYIKKNLKSTDGN